MLSGPAIEAGLLQGRWPFFCNGETRGGFSGRSQCRKFMGGQGKNVGGETDNADGKLISRK